MDPGSPDVSDRAQVGGGDRESFPAERREIGGSSLEFGPCGHGAQIATDGRAGGGLRVVGTRTGLPRSVGLELLSAFDGADPMMTKRSMELHRGCRKSGIGKVPDGDRHDGAALERPEDGGTTRGAEMISDVVTLGSSHTLDRETVVDLGLAADRNVLILRKNGTHLERASRASLAELAVTRGDGDRLALDSHLHPPAGTFRGP